MLIKIWEKLHNLAARDIVVEVEHVKAHRTKKEKEQMTQYERFVTEGNEKADDLAKAGAMLDEGFMAEARAEALQQEREREEVYVALQYAASFHYLRNGKIVKNSSLNRKKSGFSLTRRVREQSIEQSGVRKQTSISV